MIINIARTEDEMAREAASCAADAIRKAIEENGKARIILATGESQLKALECLTGMDVDWGKVTMFHLDEYIRLPMAHKASFRKYLKERFVDVVKPAAAFLVDGEGDVAANIEELTRELRREPVDVALIGIGENGHIAFNDPPADFEAVEAYRVVELDERCKQQQVNEGWFETIDEVPRQAISMTVPQIMKSRTIVSIVPGVRKGEAVYKTLTARKAVSLIPATILKAHADWRLFLDAESAALAIPQI